MKNNFCKIDLSSFPFKLSNYDVRDLIINDEILIVTTIDGNVIIINFR